MAINYSKNFTFSGREASYRARNTETNRTVGIEIMRGREQPRFDIAAGHPLLDNYYEPSVFGDGPQGEMFHSIKPKFYSMFADRSMRVPAMKLAMRAVMDHPGIVPSNDLSKHSAPLVRRAVEMGVVPLPPGYTDASQITRVNTAGFMEESSDYDFAHMLSDTEMGEANAAMRAALKRGKGQPLPHPKPLGMQFQPQLPIFEQPPDPTNEFSRRDARRDARGGW